MRVAPNVVLHMVLMMIFSGYVVMIVTDGLITSAQVFGVEEGYLKSTLVLIACDWEVL